MDNKGDSRYEGNTDAEALEWEIHYTLSSAASESEKVPAAVMQKFWERLRSLAQSHGWKWVGV